MVSYFQSIYSFPTDLSHTRILYFMNILVIFKIFVYVIRTLIWHSPTLWLKYNKENMWKHTLTSGLLRFVDPSKDRYDSEAISLPPISTRKISPALVVTTPRTESPFTGTYWNRKHIMELVLWVFFLYKTNAIFIKNVYCTVYSNLMPTNFPFNNFIKSTLFPPQTVSLWNRLMWK